MKPIDSTNSDELLDNTEDCSEKSSTTVSCNLHFIKKVQDLMDEHWDSSNKPESWDKESMSGTDFWVSSTLEIPDNPRVNQDNTKTTRLRRKDYK